MYIYEQTYVLVNRVDLIRPNFFWIFDNSKPVETWVLLVNIIYHAHETDLGTRSKHENISRKNINLFKC